MYKKSTLITYTVGEHTNVRNKDGHTVVEAELCTTDPVVRCDGEMMMMPPAAR